MSRNSRSPVLGARASLTLLAAAAVSCALVATSCSEGPTAPTPATTTGGFDTFSSILNVGGTATRTFTVAVRGTVLANLAATAPQNIQLGFMVGVPRANGNGCLPNVALTTEASDTPQISVVADPGTFCVQVYDVGTLQAPASFTVTVAHP